jgi:CheY-like chemotaxis protein
MVFVALALAPPAIEPSPRPRTLPSPGALKRLSLEQLMDIEVTSVSRRPEKLSGTASAIQIITGDDIRRSGASSIPEALRLAPNLQVAQVNSSQWAVSGGQEAIEVFRETLGGADPFALVITDLGMPYVDGRHVARAVKEMSPTTPVIMLTGWGQRMADERDLPDHVDRVLSKPPRLRELNAALVEYCRPPRAT